MYAAANSIAHKLNIYPILNNILYFINSNFIKTRKYPIISIILFIIVVVLNSIQYHKDDKNYLQNKIIIPSKTKPDGEYEFPANTVHKSNIILFFYNLISINGFISNTPVYILFYMLTYFCLSLIEMNIGYLSFLFLLFIGIMFNFFWDQFQDAICMNKISIIKGIESSAYCCSSFILFMSLGFVLYIIQNNLHNIYLRLLVIFIIIFMYFILALVDRYTQYDNVKDSSERICKMFTWHGATFIFGVFCAAVLSK